MSVQDRREREREARRRVVLDAARSLLCERGFSGTTTKQIAERAELSEATLFWYFKSKDDLLTSLLFEGIDFIGAGLAAIAGEAVEPEEKLGRLWRFFGALQEEHPEYLHVFTYLAHPQATAAVDDALKAEILRRSGANFVAMEALVRDATGAAHPRVIVDLVWSAFMGLMVLRGSRANLGAKAHPSERDFGAALKLLLGGIRAR